MTTWFCSLTFSRTQMKWSDSKVKVCTEHNGQRRCTRCEDGDAGATRVLAWNEMDAGCTPRLESWRCSQKAMGFEVSMAVEREEDTSSSSRAKCRSECFGSKVVTLASVPYALAHPAKRHATPSNARCPPLRTAQSIKVYVLGSSLCVLLIYMMVKSANSVPT